MKQEIKVPSIGESVNEVTLASWLVEDGDYVELDQPLAEFESDKATFELPAEVAGIVTRVAKEGDDIKIGEVVATIDTSASKTSNDNKQEEKAIVLLQELANSTNPMQKMAKELVSELE